MPFKDRMPPEKLRRAREMAANPTRSEASLWKRLKGNQLGVPFVFQEPVLGYTVDYYCDVAKLVVEVDGSVHESKWQRAHDSRKDRVLSAKGLVVLRLPTTLTTDQMVERIELKLHFLQVDRIPSSKQPGGEAA